MRDFKPQVFDGKPLSPEEDRLKMESLLPTYKAEIEKIANGPERWAKFGTAARLGQLRNEMIRRINIYRAEQGLPDVDAPEPVIKE